jgi:hypothetical protein
MLLIKVDRKANLNLTLHTKMEVIFDPIDSLFAESSKTTSMDKK